VTFGEVNEGGEAMSSSLRALLAGVIDYAGLFPPARLPLDQAFRNHVRYRREAGAWMLGRFVIPAARLHELERLHHELSKSEEPFVFAALGRGGEDLNSFLEGLGADLQAAAGFQKQYPRQVRVEVLEVRLPPGAADPARQNSTRVLLDFAATLISRLGPAGLTLAYEVGSVPDSRAAAQAVVGSLAWYNAMDAVKQRTCCSAVFKLRCGGLEAAAFPSPEQVAFTLDTCRSAGVPLKFTAGLHHPLRHLDPGLQTPMHGFVNVLTAGALAHSRHLGAEQIRAILEDEDPSHFIFTDEAMRWKDLRASTEEIAAARREAVLSFGSCSFDEPRDDLRALGWL
jgi:hypothetical protein